MKCPSMALKIKNIIIQEQNRLSRHHCHNDAGGCPKSSPLTIKTISEIFTKL